MATRMKDIAAELGLSLITISKALRNHPDIAETTKRRVVKRARELNYRPNLMARSLVTGQSSLIGLVVPDLLHPYFAEIAKSLSSALRRKNLFLVVAASDQDPEMEQAEIEHLLAHRLDALVVASVQNDPRELRKLQENGPPLILFDRFYLDLPSHFVGINDYRAGQLATEHLLSTGRKYIAHIRGPETSASRGRMSGFADTMKRQTNRGVRHVIVTPENRSDGRSGGEAGMQQVLSLESLPDAVFCHNDAIAIGAMVKASDAGLRVPEDVAIVGCGNFPYADVLQVPLSSVDQKIQDTGTQIAKIIFDVLKAKASIKPRSVMIEPQLVVRRSSAASRSPTHSIPPAPVPRRA